MPRLLSYWSAVVRRLENARARRSELARLASSGDPVSTKLAWAIDRVIRKSLLEEEENWIDRIEQRRSALIDLDETVSFTDFGAGEPEDHLDEKEMEKGRLIELSLKHLCEHTSQSYPWAHLFFQLVRHLKPRRSLELGTCLGFSAAYQTAALELNQTGKLLTLEGAAPLAQRARDNFKWIGLTCAEVRVGKFADTLDAALADYQPLDFVYIDGHHDGDATLDYFQSILPALSDDAVVVFDDILWYDGMRDAWSRIKMHQQVRVSIDIGAMGIVVVAPDAQRKEDYRFLLH